MSKSKKVLKVVAGILILAVMLTAGYALGLKAGTSSVTTALPKKTMDHEESNTEEVSSPEPTEKDGVYIGKSNVSAVENGKWTTVDKYSYDITGDGTNDDIVLYTSAQTSEGEIMWDDGQNWILEMSDGSGGYYTLAQQYISRGNIYYEVSELDDNKKAITVYAMSGVGFSIKQYIFSQSGFNENQLYSSGVANTMHSSIPYYK